MGLLFCDSFDHYDTAEGAQKWDAGFPASASIYTLNPRTGTRSLAIVGAFGPTKYIGNQTTLFFGTAVYLNILPTIFTGSLVRFRDLSAGTDQVAIDITGSGAIRGLRNTTVLGTSAGGVIPAGAYTYVEVKVVISTSAGEIIIRVNGVEVLNLQNVNTDAALTGIVDGLQLMSFGGGGAWLHDDVYICDNLGGVNDSFLGPVKIYMEVPTSDGAPLDWTPSTGLTHFNLVDEVPPNITDFNSSGGVGDQDQYLYPNTGIPNPSTVVAIQHTMSAALDIAGARSVGSCVNGIAATGQALSTSYVMIPTPYDTKPGGGAWVFADIATTEFGPEVTA